MHCGRQWRGTNQTTKMVQWAAATVEENIRKLRCYSGRRRLGRILRLRLRSGGVAENSPQRWRSGRRRLRGPKINPQTKMAKQRLRLGGQEIPKLRRRSGGDGTVKNPQTKVAQRSAAVWTNSATSLASAVGAHKKRNRGITRNDADQEDDQTTDRKT